MKYAPKKVFISENGIYKEITYSEFKKFEKTDKSYKGKLFLPLYGTLMEVTEEIYKSYYKDLRRQKYIDECSRKRGDVSYNALDTDETLGEETFADPRTDVEAEVISRMMIEKLHNAFLLLLPSERELIKILFFDDETERKAAEIYGVSQVAIHKRKNKILAKLKEFLEK